MKIILAGSRPPVEYRSNLHELERWYSENACHVADAMIVSHYFDKATIIVCGKAQGFDTLGERWAKLNGIPVDHYPADWKAFGKAAGAIRNGEMARVADALVAIQEDQPTPGTSNMIATMRKLKKPVFVWNIKAQVGTQY